MPAKTPKASLNRKREVFLVEDHPVTREGLAQLINYQDDLHVCGSAGTVAKALGGIDAARPDLVVVDVSLPDGHGIELVKDIKARFPDQRVLVLSMHDETLYAERAIRAGASGYIMKQEPTDAVLAAARQILSGKTYLSPKLQERVLQRFAAGLSAPVASEVERLTDRELEIFELIGRGRGTREIAEQLRLSVSTVETHRAHLKEKLELESATELVRRAVEWVSSREKRMALDA
jgi:DNA-binding NarL/FixJ family response regulator